MKRITRLAIVIGIIGAIIWLNIQFHLYTYLEVFIHGI